MAHAPHQLELRPRTWGGRRDGAGRKPSRGRRSMPHRRRPLHNGRCPAHVTLRARANLPSLRRTDIFSAMRGAFAREHPGAVSGCCSSVCRGITCTYSSRRTMLSCFEAESRGSRSGWRKGSTAPCVGGEPGQPVFGVVVHGMARSSAARGRSIARRRPGDVARAGRMEAAWTSRDRRSAPSTTKHFARCLEFMRADGRRLGASYRAAARRSGGGAGSTTTGAWYSSR